MPVSSLFTEPLDAAGPRLRPRVVLAAGLLFLAAALLLPPVAPPFARLALAMTGAVLGFAALWLAVVPRIVTRSTRRHAARISAMLADDPIACLIATAEGRLQHVNPAATRLLAPGRAQSLPGALQKHLANPRPLLLRLESRAAVRGAAREDVITRDGHLQITVNRAPGGLFLWRIEKTAERPSARADPMPLPMITAGRGDSVLFMNAAARNLVGGRMRRLDDIFPRLPLRSGQLQDINTRDGLAVALVVELEGIAGRREIFLLPGLAAAERLPDGWAFFDELPVALLKLARDGTVQLSNRPARDLLGVAACAGRQLCEMVEGLGRPITDWLDDAAAGRGTVHAEVLRVRREDREVYAQITLSRAQEAGETVLIAVLADATELKTLEAQFVQSQKMQAIGQLAGGVAHDFNNLLTAISGHCDLLLLRHDPQDDEYADLMQISQNVNRAAALVGQLLAYSRKQTLRPEAFDLRDTLADLTHLLNRLVGEQVSLILDHDPDLWAIRADRRQLEQVLMNLVLNARDAMPEGGVIRIETENRRLEAALRRDRAVVAPGRYVCLRVVDEGMGIPADRLDKVFEPFFTTKRLGEGTGLGLSTAYGIVKQTGGFIFVDSTPGEGSRFTLLFPAHEGDRTAVAGPPVRSASRGAAGGVVLLVEDEAPVRAFASRALQMRGLSVIEADSAEEALTTLADPELQVDVFVTDVVMPGRDGPSWVAEALRDRPDTRVVLVSGYAEESLGNAASRLPDAVFLPKPFSLSDLTETVIAQITQRRRGENATAAPAAIAPPDLRRSTSPTLPGYGTSGEPRADTPATDQIAPYGSPDHGAAVPEASSIAQRAAAFDAEAADPDQAGAYPTRAPYSLTAPRSDRPPAPDKQGT